MNLLAFGFGYSARALAALLARCGWQISGTVTTEAGAAAMRSIGHIGLTFDGRGPGSGVTDALSRATHLLLSIPPGPDGDPALLHHGAEIAASPSVRWIGYFSTVAVYGDRQGGWVDETTSPAPMSERGRRRLDAEQAWLKLGARSGKPTTVFRLPGIYGPGRSPFDDLRAGTARRLVKPGQVFNRIHVEDIAGALVASIERPVDVSLVNVTDDEPAPPQDVVAHAARLGGFAMPPEIDFETADLTPMARSFYGESKRVSNRRLKEVLGYRLRYPTYREGLAAILARESR